MAGSYELQKEYLYGLPKGTATPVPKTGAVSRALVQNNLINKIANKVVKGLKRVFFFCSKLATRRLGKRIPLRNDSVLFCVFQRNYNCNAKYITEELLRRKAPYRIVWAVKNQDAAQTLPKGVIPVKYGSYAFYCELLSAHIWFDNALNLLWNFPPKKPEQVLINTWHGSLGIKRIDDSHSRYWLKVAKYNSDRTDYLLSDSDFDDQVFKTSWWPDTPTLRYGHPRNDLLVCPDQDKASKVRGKLWRKYGIAKDKKLVIYATTIRDTDSTAPLADFAGLCRALERRFGGEWVVLFRRHPRDTTPTTGLFNQQVVNVSNYIDIQELLLVSEVGITDYSSWIFDYMLTGRPAFVFAPDEEAYSQSERNFYYPLSQTPFPIAHSDQELQANVEAFDEAAYACDLQAFLDDKGCIEDGHAAERTCDLIDAIIAGRPEDIPAGLPARGTANQADAEADTEATEA
jgi:CDP-glycerol glycerophosphotransferase